MRKLHLFLLSLMVLFAIGPAVAVAVPDSEKDKGKSAVEAPGQDASQASGKSEEAHAEHGRPTPGSSVAPSPGDDEGDNLHPSGKDRETNDGPPDDDAGSSGSDPDDDGRGPDRSNGGPDKTGGRGGVDKNDQDGNNGCGNDDDFEDDNEGWCGRKPKPQPSPTVRPTPTPTPSTPGPSPSPSVTPTTSPTPGPSPTVSPSPGPSVSPGPTPGTEPTPGSKGTPTGPTVAGSTERTPQEQPAGLPFTGGAVGNLVYFALLLLFIGCLAWFIFSRR